MPRRDERYRAVEADRGLDSQLRTLIDATPVPGHICVSFRREPDFFHGLHIQGRRNQVLAVMDGEEMVGLACRSVKPMFVNGQAMDFGYFSGLRITPGHRGGPVSDVGHQLMHQFHDADPVPGYPCLASRRSDQGAQHAHGRRLASAVGSEKAEYLP